MRNSIGKLFSLVAVLVVASSIFSPVLASTLPDEDIQSIYSDTVWYKGVSDELCSGDLTPGKGAPDGGNFPNLDPAVMANAINQWIVKENPNSKLKGLGSTIVAGAKNSNVNPFLIVTIARKESSLADPSDYNVRGGNNSFGRTATSSQPNFQGAKLWYKWTSVKASVDYTAAENRNAQGGGDMAAYLRNQFGPQLDHSNLTALLMLYAPPGENDTSQYIAQVEGWINELVKLSKGGVSAATDNSSCAGAVAGDAVRTAINYAWPDYHFPPYCKERPSYKTAIDAASQRGEYTGGTCTVGGTWIGVDCGAFVTRVMRDSKADTKYNQSEGNTIYQQNYMDSHPEKYQKLPNVNGTAQLKPGDIAINDVHTYMYVGAVAGFHGNSASASFSDTGLSWRAPMASNAYAFDTFTWYRLK